MAEDSFGTVGRPRRGRSHAASGAAARGTGAPPSSGLPPAGWYPDGSGRAPLRYWTGTAWSQWVYDGKAVSADPQGLHRRLDPSDLSHLDFVESVFLPDARAAGCIRPGDEGRLARLLATMRADAVQPGPAAAAAGALATPQRPHPAPAHPEVRPGPALGSSWGTPATFPGMPRTGIRSAGAPGAGAPRTGVPPTGVPQAGWPTTPQRLPTAPAPRPPSAATRWWQHTREAVGSDLALHGLAYLGVLLFFVGAFGLVVFAFGDVAPNLRPVAELLIALVPFGAAALLLRRGATVVGRALEVVGGLLLPVMVVTGFLDGVRVPPDLEGTALVVALTTAVSLVAVAYALWSWRHPTSALRYLVAPVAWLAVAMVTLGLGPRAVPEGKAVATPSAAQAAALTAAIVVTLVWARLRPAHRLAGPSTAVALPGLVVVGTMAVLTWAAEDWPFTPVLVTGVLVLVALQLLVERIPATALGVIEPVWWALTSLALGAGSAAAGVDAAAVATVSAAGFVTLVEAGLATRRPVPAQALAGAGLAVALTATMADPWWAVGALGVASAWAVVRRVTPPPSRTGALVLGAASVALPPMTLANLALATDVPPALVAGAALVLGATVLARWHLLTRSPGDRFWTLWWGTLGTVVLATTGLALIAWDVWTQRERWLLVATLALLTSAAVTAPVRVGWRPLLATVPAGLGWVAAAGILELSELATAVPVALAALAMVVVAHTPRAVSTRPPAAGLGAGLGLTGHLLAVVTVLAPPLVGWVTGWVPAVTVGLATVGFAVTAWRDATAGSAVTAALTRVGGWLGWAPLALALTGIPATASLVLDESEVLPLGDTWALLVPVVAGVAYAAATRLPLPRRVVTGGARAGFALTLCTAVGAVGRVFWAASLGTASELVSRPAALAAAAVPAAVLLLRPSRRTPVMAWCAWLAPAPVTFLLALEVPWFTDLGAEAAIALTLVAVGSVLRVGGAAADLRGRTWTPTLRPAHAWALAPVVVGAAELVLGLLVAIVAVPAATAGWILAGGACVILVTAALTRVGAATAAAVTVGWVGALMLALPTIEARPWIAVVTVLALLVVAEALSRLPETPVWWARWDLPVLVAAAPVAVTALAVAAGGPTAAAVTAAVGAECIAVGARLWRQPVPAATLGSLGGVLVLAGAGTAGPGWLALALTGLAAALTVLAVRISGTARVLLQVGGAVAAWSAWLSTTTWLELSDQRAVDSTAVVAAALAGAAAAASFVPQVHHSWLRVWGGSAVLVEIGCATVALAPMQWSPSTATATWPVVGALAVVTASLAAAAGRLATPWLRDAAVVAGFATILAGTTAAGATTTDRIFLLSMLSIAGAALTLVVAHGRWAGDWLRPIVEAGAGSVLWAAVASVVVDERPMVLVLVLVAAAVQAAAAGVALRLVLLQMASPVLACAAWIVFAGEALGGNPQWVTVAVGLAVLVVVALWRLERVEHGGSPSATEIVALELAGIGFLAGSSLVQAVTESVLYAALAAAIGVAVAAWGVVTRVRRRLAAGAALVLLALALLVGVPLVRLLPSWEGAALWALIGGVGLVVILVAVLLERGKAAARSGLARFAEATSGWE